MFGMFVLHPGSWSQALKFQPQPLPPLSQLLPVASGSTRNGQYTSSHEKPRRIGTGGSHSALQIFLWGICIFVEQGEDPRCQWDRILGLWGTRKERETPWKVSASPSGWVMSQQGASHTKTLSPPGSHNTPICLPHLPHWSQQS